MLDARLVADNPDLISENLARRNADEATLAIPTRIAELSETRNRLLQAAEAGRATRNQLSPQIGQMMKAGQREEAEALKAEVRRASEAVKESESALTAVEEERTTLLMSLPNLLHESVPDGKGEHENVEVRRWGAPPDMSFEPKPHDELAAELGLLDQEQSARISGARFAVLHGGLAALERALINFFIDTHTQEHGYQEVMVPYVVWREAMEGTGQLPKFEEDAFKLAAPLNGQDAFLIPTAEVPVTNLFRGQLIDGKDLPKAYVAFTPCFRSEAGSYGKDTRGLIRQHQFHKVEMVRITRAETAVEEHEALTGHAEAILQALGLHYRTVRLCGGDIGFGASLCYDIEVWLPGQKAFREISSCSLYGDFQSRRMKMRYRPDGEKSKPIFCHTINGSGLAVGRTLVAILENYQQADGTVLVPEVLRGYMRGLDRITPLN
ncbi:MAG: serine--tRNA ligase [Myxococcota bacterium]|jgi:seryl-tRNA synthetase|nr:serine--tRNA ligase [Myxococcota bacterium]